MVDATKWQKEIIKRRYGDIRGSEIGICALQHASTVVGHRIHSPHAADALCLLEFGRLRVPQQLPAP